MSRSARDLLYRIYIIIHVFATSLLTVPTVLPRSMVPEICFKPVQWYLANYNDPLVAKKGFPGGWFGGFSVCEAWLQLPYFLWAMTLPIGDKRLELPSLVYAIHAGTAVLACICELYAFPDTVMNTSDRIIMGASYIPFQIVTGIMAIDMYKRVRRRMEATKQE